MPPLWDQTGVPGEDAFFHFHSSTTSGSALWMSSRIRFSTEPRQSPSPRMRWSIVCEPESGVRGPSFRGTANLLSSKSQHVAPLQAVLSRRRGHAPRRTGHVLVDVEVACRCVLGSVCEAESMDAGIALAGANPVATTW